MASSKKAKVQSSSDIKEKLKNKIINKYIRIKKDGNGKDIYKDDFVKESGFSYKEMKEVFGGFRELKQLGEAKYRDKLPQAQRALLSEKSKKFDPTANKDDCIEDLRELAGKHSLGAISRSFYREHGRYSDSTWNSFFGSFQEFRRQAGLELSRHQHKFERSIAQHASHDHYKVYYEKEYAPFYRKYEKPKATEGIRRIMIISDLHDKECDEFTLATFISECDRKQPDIIVLNGDIFDLLEFGKYSVDLREIDILGRFRYVWDNVFAPLRNACPDAQIDMVIGNHEFRLLRLLADATPNVRVLLSDVMGLELKDVFKLDDYQINLVSKFNLGAFSAKDVENELRRNYQIYYGCYVVCHEPDKNLMIMSGTNGHHHRLSQVSNAFPDPTTGKTHQVTWVQTPAGHKKDATYIQNMCKWNTGFLEVIINLDEKEVIQRIQQTYDKWTDIDGIIYRRKND
jgi:predicted phosphodiesterase